MVKKHCGLELRTLFPYKLLFICSCCLSLLLSLSPSQSWHHPESLSFTQNYLHGEKSIEWKNWREAFDLQALDSGPRISRPIENFFNFLNAWSRQTLWKIIPPHPSLSLHHVILYFLCPLFLWLLFGQLKWPEKLRWILLSLFILSPGVLYLSAVQFRSAKPLSLLGMIILLYLSPKKTRLLFPTLLFFLLCDETIWLMVPVLAIFSPNKKNFQSLALATLSYSFLLWMILPKFFGQSFSTYEHTQQLIQGKLFQFQFLPANLKNVFFDLLGLPLYSEDLSLGLKLLTLIYLGTFLFALRGQKKFFFILCLSFLFHHLLMQIKTGVWGISWYGHYLPLFFILFLGSGHRQSVFPLLPFSLLSLFFLSHQFIHTNPLHRDLHYLQAGQGIEKIYQQKLNPHLYHSPFPSQWFERAYQVKLWEEIREQQRTLSSLPMPLAYLWWEH